MNSRSGERELPSKDYITLGRISGAYGVRGWVKVFSYTEPRENILNYSRWFLAASGQFVEVLEGRRQGPAIVARLSGIDDRDRAVQLKDDEIRIKRAQLPPLESGYYWTDLIGLDVFDREGGRIGIVANLLETGANDVLLVRGEREHLIPFVLEQFVLNVDLVAQRIDVDWITDD